MREYFFTVGLHPWDKDVGGTRRCVDDWTAIAIGRELGADYVYAKLPENRCECVWRSDHVKRHEERNR